MKTFKTVVITAIIVTVLVSAFFLYTQSKNKSVKGGYLIDEGTADSYAETVRKDVFGSDESGAVFLISEVDNWEDEYVTFAMGKKAEALFGGYKDNFSTAYERHYNDDIAYQVREAIYDVLDMMEENGEQSIESTGAYKGQKFIEDKVNAFDTKSKLATALEDFHKATGIKLYVISANYDVFCRSNGAVPEQMKNPVDWPLILVVIGTGVFVLLMINYMLKQNRAKED